MDAPRGRDILTIQRIRTVDNKRVSISSGRATIISSTPFSELKPLQYIRTWTTGKTAYTSSQGASGWRYSIMEIPQRKRVAAQFSQHHRSLLNSVSITAHWAMTRTKWSVKWYTESESLRYPRMAIPWELFCGFFCYCIPIVVSQCWLQEFWAHTKQLCRQAAWATILGRRMKTLPRINMWLYRRIVIHGESFIALLVGLRYMHFCMSKGVWAHDGFILFHLLLEDDWWRVSYHVNDTYGRVILLRVSIIKHNDSVRVLLHPVLSICRDYYYTRIQAVRRDGVQA
jgi:hypothetical protein